MRRTGFLVAAVIAVGLVSACSAQGGAGRPADAGGKPAGVVENPPPPAGAEHQSGDVENVGADDLRFPGTTVTAVLTGYDRKLQMASFELVELVSGTNMEPYYQDVAGDGPHRLPLSPDLKVWSAFGICTTGSPTGITVDEHGRANQPCTKDQFLAALDDDGMTAEVKVDDQDRIAEVTELYHP